MSPAREELFHPTAVRCAASWFRKLPGIGRRTAERLALALIDWDPEELKQFGEDLARFHSQIHTCTTCGNLADSDTCPVCDDPRRQRDTICVVETPAQIPVIEKAGCYRGLYHVLGGRIMPLEGKGPDELRIQELLDRLDGHEVNEVIVATSPDVEGEATAHYLAEVLTPADIQVTRIASGVPAGADLSYADAATMAMAMGGRRDLR